MIHLQKPECLWEYFDCCIQSEGHSEGSKYQWIFVWLISSEPQNLLWPNLVWWCTMMSQNVMQKDLCSYFRVKVTVRVYIIKIWLFLLCLLNCWSFCNQSLMVCHYNLECFVRKLNCSRSRSQWVFGWCLLNHGTFCYQTWNVEAILWVRVSFEKIGLLSLMSRSQWRLI